MAQRTTRSLFARGVLRLERIAVLVLLTFTSVSQGYRQNTGGVRSQYPDYVKPPYLLRLYPDKGHTCGGTHVTIYGGGFVRNTRLTVRFSHLTGEIDEVPATFIDQGRISCVTPARDDPHSAHVAVANNGVAFSSYPLVTEDEGAFLSFIFVADAPGGKWTLDNSTGPVEGGTEVIVEAWAFATSTRVHNGNFLPHDHLRCRFGEQLPRPQQVQTVVEFPHQVEDPWTQIALAEAVAIDPEVRLDEEIRTPIPTHNTVLAQWLNYGRIRCVSPPWDQVTDNEPEVGGKQVTVYVTNDQLDYRAGGDYTDYEDIDDQVEAEPLAKATFTYYDNQPYTNPMQYAPLQHRLRLWGSDAASGRGDGSGAEHSFYGLGAGDLQDGLGQGLEGLGDGRTACLRDARVGSDDVAVEGRFLGDGQAEFEVEVDGQQPDTFRWRAHLGAFNASADWADVFVPTGHDIPLLFGMRLSFKRPQGDHCVGDRWTFTVGGGRAAVVGARTSHNEPQFPARGPFEGNTEITITGNHFLPSSNLACRLYDSATGVTQILPAQYDSSTQVRCVTERHEERAGGAVLATMRPCLYKTIQVANDGKTWSSASAAARFLFCDVYVSVEGSDHSGFGTPDRPYRTLQRAIEAALTGPRIYYQYKSEQYTGTKHRGTSVRHDAHFGVTRPQQTNKGFAYYVNRDRVRVQNGIYTGPGNVGLHPLGKMVELHAEVAGAATLDCEESGFGAIIASADRNQGEDAMNIGSINLAGIPTVNCDNRRYYT